MIDDDSICKTIKGRAIVDGNYATAYALLQVAEQIKKLAETLDRE
jgi:hypothetical protein